MPRSPAQEQATTTEADKIAKRQARFGTSGIQAPRAVSGGSFGQPSGGAGATPSTFGQPSQTGAMAAPARRASMNIGGPAGMNAGAQAFTPGGPGGNRGGGGGIPRPGFAGGPGSGRGGGPGSGIPRGGGFGGPGGGVGGRGEVDLAVLAEAMRGRSAHMVETRVEGTQREVVVAEGREGLRELRLGADAVGSSSFARSFARGWKEG